MAIKTNGSLWAWGRNNEGQLGNGTVNDGSRLDVNHCFCKLDSRFDDSELNNFCRYNDEINLPSYTPVPIKIMDSVSAVSAGYQYTMAVKTDGSLWAWGDNSYGQLGDGTTDETTGHILDGEFCIMLGNIAVISHRHIPIKIMDSVSAVSMGVWNAMAIKTDGSLWAWGRYISNLLVDGKSIKSNTPIKIMEEVKMPS